MTAKEMHCDFLIIGGGPAGLAAGTMSASRGLRTFLVDERPTLGGQIYKQPGPGFVVNDPSQMGRDYERGISLVEAARRAGVEFSTTTSVVSLRGTSAILLIGGSIGTFTMHAKRVLIAPGAHDRPVPFPGWTLPGVITAGGAQSLVKTSRVIPGDRVAFAGSGPLALAFPAQLRHYGVNVLLALEAGAAPNLRSALSLLRALPGNVELLREGIDYRRQLLKARIPLRYRRIIVRAEGNNCVESMVHAAVDKEWRIISGTEERIEVDTICLGYGFVPSGELFRLAECSFGFDEDLGGSVVEIDEWCRTSVPGIYGAGDGTGVRGSLVAIGQGRLAGLRAAIDLGAISASDGSRLAGPIRRRIAAKERFRRALGPMFSVGPGIYGLATPETIVCRCEEVSQSRLDEAINATNDINSVKSYTRAGMGLCQGRNCQRQIVEMIAAQSGTSPEDVHAATQRPPIRPVPLGMLADFSLRDPGLWTRD
jgi:thioredoxin reductase